MTSTLHFGGRWHWSNPQRDIPACGATSYRVPLTTTDRECVTCRACRRTRRYRGVD